MHDLGALALAALALGGIVFGLWGFENPLVTGRPVGGPFFNLILLGYGLPAVLAAILALIARATRPYAYRVVAAVAAVGLALAYLSLEVTTLYHGPVLTRGATSNAEHYTYSAVWLAFGVLLLLAGVFLRSQPARLASAAVVLITVGKVFLLDLAAELSARALYQEAATYCHSVRDYVTRDQFEKLMADEESHIDFLETQLDLVAKLGLELYAQHHIGELEDKD